MFLKIYTDGSCKANGSDSSIGGYGFLAIDENNKVVYAYQQNNIQNTTSNRMELTAIIAAYFMVVYPNSSKGSLTYFYSDSSYAINSLFKWRFGWKGNGWSKKNGEEIKNLDLIREFDRLAYNFTAFEHAIIVKGHSGILWNELADKLATGEITVEEVMKKYG